MINFDEALRQAEIASQHDEVPVGAALYEAKTGELVTSAYNQRETLANPMAHAEIQCLAQAAKIKGAWNLSGCVLVVTLEPCPMCLGAIQQARIDKVIYGAKDNKGGAIELGYEFHKDVRMHHRFEVEFQENDNCSQILSQFFQRKRAKK